MAETPPGPKGEPLFGSSRTYASDPFRFISALEDAYGDVAYFDMGPMETVMLCDPAAIERVLVSEADRFRKPDFQGDALGDLLGDGLLLSEGDTWEQQRQLANPAFSMRRLSGMAGRITDHTEDRLAGWDDGDVVNAERVMTRTTLDVILDLMMGVELGEERVAEIEQQLLPLGQRFEPDPLRFAAPEWMPMPDDAEFEAAVASLDAILDDIISVRERTAGSGDDGPMDFLSVLIRARDDGVESPEQLRDEMMTMLLAGHDTTALTLTYTWFLLSEHPEIERRVHEELDEVVGDERPGMAHVRELDYLEWVIQEAMRLYPPVYTMFREPIEAVELSGYPVESGMTLMLPQWGVHRSERFYEDPDTFDPERWKPDRANDRPRFAYFPFGGGPRHCIGKHLAMLEAQLIVATTAQQYRLEFLGETPLELMPSLTAHPRQEMSMRVVERN
ncbi:cytochrome P450 [Haloarcula sp. S1CR25-12]|uniref:Cytochrome P450 n=1 Tax=Haloarcula saliterrae TaxID=2950534 RepID=A0ABU2F9R3_9EURY|nr:cytochrome P450 [Haloarcula sp. S1CR25-12]MDS0259020.1 cytochrome P450 [Haloarcula sp. S1CR25-12]